MKKVIRVSALLILLSFLPGAAFAACFNAGGVYTCLDNAGNAYGSVRAGNNVYTNQYNPGGLSSQSGQIGGNIIYRNNSANGSNLGVYNQSLGNAYVQSTPAPNGGARTRVCTQFGCF
jgi:hypothetical protein